MNDAKFYSFLGIIKKSGNLSSGYNTCEIQIKKGKGKMVLVAEDASHGTQDKFVNMCKANNIPFIIHGNKGDIGSSIGKMPTSVIVINDENMSKVVLNMLR
ncbi:MAG: ribosomal L7Ae/L30e/S12e/Gadd45 family protein [Clostridiales bacterium]|nr:ribosomal L7Ae/L30e/S12e/Gadd45 family protein [Clostridiales bacterium]HBM81214.1 50S ribosomal protein L7ae [Clostridiaceae bacterium]